MPDLLFLPNVLRQDINKCTVKLITAPLSKRFQTGCKAPGLSKKNAALPKKKPIGAKSTRTKSKQSDGQSQISDFLMKAGTNNKAAWKTGGYDMICID